MRQETWNLITAGFLEFRDIWAEPVPAREFDEAFAFIPFGIDPDYREFVIRYGGGFIGSNPVYGLRLAAAMGTAYGGARTAPELSLALREARWPHIGDWLVFSTDGDGAPVGFRPQGDIGLADDSGQVFSWGKNFEDWVRRVCFRLEE